MSQIIRLNYYYHDESEEYIKMDNFDDSFWKVN